jgi:hypothetical protein
MINLQRTNIFSCGFKYFPLKVKPKSHIQERVQVVLRNFKYQQKESFMVQNGRRQALIDCCQCSWSQFSTVGTSKQLNHAPQIIFKRTLGLLKKHDET